MRGRSSVARAPSPAKSRDHGGDRAAGTGRRTGGVTTDSRKRRFPSDASITDHQRRVIAQLNGRSQVDAFEAAKAIWQDHDASLERPLLQTLGNGRSPFNRAAAAYAMQMITTPKTIRALERTVENKSETPRVRGEAAEALTHAHRKKTHNVLLRGLGDRSKDVRYWSAFALGEMAERRALIALRRLVVTDKRIIKGFWSVAKEASDAIEKIETENIAHRRKNGCVFCLRGLRH